MSNFDKDLKRGEIGETLFSNMFGEFVAKSKDYAYDFIFTEAAKELCGKTIEIKTDSYDPRKTRNFFMERHSNDTKMDDGGPWRGKRDGIHWYVYIFPIIKTMYVFESIRLVDRLNEICQGKGLVTVKGVGYNPYRTLGYKVPIKEVEDLAAKVPF